MRKWFKVIYMKNRCHDLQIFLRLAGWCKRQENDTYRLITWFIDRCPRIQDIENGIWSVQGR